VLSLQGINRRRGAGAESFLLEVPSFEVPAGACVALTGASGSGKSTMLDLLGLVLRPDAAARFCIRTAAGVELDVAELWRRDAGNALAAIRARLIGYVLQTGGLLPFLTAADNITLSPRLLGLRAEPRVLDQLIDVLGLRRLLTKKPQALSIGERQRVAIARALAHRPELLLADEPTAALDPHHAAEVMQLLLGLVRELGTTAIIVSHDWDLMRSFGLREVRAESVPTPTGSATRFVC